MRRQSTGFTLLELVIAAGLGAVLMLGLVQATAAVSASALLQDNQAQLLDRSRLAVEILSRAVRNAGFNPSPWDPALHIDDGLADSLDSAVRADDRLVVTQWSDKNCFDNQNPVKDTDGNPVFYYRETTFELSSDRHLSLQCRFGPSKQDLIRQIGRQGVIKGVVSFQLQFAVDLDSDGTTDRWINAGSRNGHTEPTGVRFALLLSSDQAVITPAERKFSLLDRPVLTFRDGLLRRALEFEVALRSRI